MIPLKAYVNITNMGIFVMVIISWSLLDVNILVGIRAKDLRE